MTKQISQLSFPANGGASLTPAALTCNMILSIVGTTVLGVGYQMTEGGWVLTPVLLVVGCCIISEMTWLISRTIDKLQADNRALGHQVKVEAYADFAELAFGAKGRMLSSITSTFALLGMICGGLIVETKNLQYAAPLLCKADATGPCPNPEDGRKLWAVIMSSTTLLYVFVDIGPLLKCTAQIGPVVCLCCVFLAVWAGIKSMMDLQDFPEECRTGPQGEPFTILAAQLNDLDEIAGIMAYGFYVFAVVVTVPSLKAQMSQPHRLVVSSITAYGICAVAFLVIQFFTYSGQGNLAPESIIDSMHTNRPAGWWATNSPWVTGEATVSGRILAWSLILNLVLTDAIYVPCCLICIQAWCPDLMERSPVARVTARVLLVLFRCACATVIESFVSITRLTSSAFCVCNNVLMPITAYYVTGTYRAEGTSKPRTVAHVLMFLFGFFVVIVGTFGAVKDMVAPEHSKTATVGSFPRTEPYGISEACQTAYIQAVTNSSYLLSHISS